MEKLQNFCRYISIKYCFLLDWDTYIKKISKTKLLALFYILKTSDFYILKTSDFLWNKLQSLAELLTKEENMYSNEFKIVNKIRLRSSKTFPKQDNLNNFWRLVCNICIFVSILNFQCNVYPYDPLKLTFVWNVHNDREVFGLIDSLMVSSLRTPRRVGSIV